MNVERVLLLSVMLQSGGGDRIWAPAAASGSTEVLQTCTSMICVPEPLRRVFRRPGQREDGARLICDHLSLISTSLQEDEVKVC